jgi:hypothetical protein
MPVIGLAVAWGDKRKVESRPTRRNGTSLSARQFDPRSGAWTPLPKPSAGDRYEYRPPDRQDWVVVLARQ